MLTCMLVAATSEAVPCSRAQTPLLSFRCFRYLITLSGEQDNSHLSFTATVTATEVQVQGTPKEKNTSHFLMWSWKLITLVFAPWKNTRSSAENINQQESLQVGKHQVQRPSKQAHPTKGTSSSNKPSLNLAQHMLCATTEWDVPKQSATEISDPAERSPIQLLLFLLSSHLSVFS